MRQAFAGRWRGVSIGLASPAKLLFATLHLALHRAGEGRPRLVAACTHADSHRRWRRCSRGEISLETATGSSIFPGTCWLGGQAARRARLYPPGAIWDDCLQQATNMQVTVLGHENRHLDPMSSAAGDESALRCLWMITARQWRLAGPGTFAMLHCIYEMSLSWPVPSS